MRPLNVFLLAFTSAVIGCSGSNGNGGANGGTLGAGGGSGASAGGSASGSGGATSGGASMGGASMGGTPTSGGSTATSGGGSASGGAAAGGNKASGGNASGGNVSGGSNASGGATSGGKSGNATGGNATGGSTNGGSANGGKSGNATGGSGGASTTCDPQLSAKNRTTVSKAIDELFVQKDASAIDRYWADPYLQHNPIAKSGLSTFKSLIGSAVQGSGFSYQRFLTLAECDLAVVYGRYSQTGVIFDMFRVKDDKIMEHWDSDTGGASESTGIAALDASAPSAANKTLFLDFSAAVLVGGERTRAADFLSTGYVEHHGTRATGPSALSAFLMSENVSYTKVHHLIADGNFVFAVSEGKRGSAAFGFYDLFRADGGKLVEHWDSRRSVPSSTMSGLPIF